VSNTWDKDPKERKIPSGEGRFGAKNWSLAKERGHRRESPKFSSDSGRGNLIGSRP
jgi:hypothetical protein